MKLYITCLPSFYKLELYNKIAEKIPIFVLFTGEDAEGRNPDFYKGEINFPYENLTGNKWVKALKVSRIVLKGTYDEVVVGGWNLTAFWAGVLFSPKKKNSVVIESSIFESATIGVSAWIKRLFMKRISKVYASGRPHERLARALGFKGEVVITKGVGVFNYHPQPTYVPRESVIKFLYVGRLVEVKNLVFLVKMFNRHPELSLTIVGFGEQEKELKTIANENIHFAGAVNNKELPDYYQTADVFILPSKSEPWGLVVEEALNNGTPVMLSDKVGCHEDLVNENTGVVFKLTEEDFEEKLSFIMDIVNYNRMREGISKLDFDKVEKRQVNCYID